MDAFETKIFLAILISAVMLAIVLIFFIVTLINHQKKHAKQYKQQIQAEIIGREAERKRIANDLHDDLGPFLSSIKLQINLLNTEDPEDTEVINQLSTEINQIVQKIRDTSNDLMPNVLVRKGLLRALSEFAHTINKTGSIKVKTEFEPEHYEFEKEVEIHLYRICQEALHNAIRHARASLFSITMKCEPQQLKMVIADNGVGFDYNKLSKDNIGLGLKNILSRVDFLNGDFYLDTQPGKGVVYTIQIPLRKV